jgi:hypothetical protein
MTTWIGDRGDRGGGNGAKQKLCIKRRPVDGVKVGEILDRKRSINRSRDAQRKRTRAQNLTGSGLDLGPETEVTKLRMVRRT